MSYRFAVVRGAAKHGAKRVRVHILLDGRDVPDGSSVADTERLEKVRSRSLVDVSQLRLGRRRLYTLRRSEGLLSTPRNRVPSRQVLDEVRSAGCDAQIASGGGRMYITMDRYEVRLALRPPQFT